MNKQDIKMHREFWGIEPLFTQDDLIYAYTRAQALEDGVLVDVTTAAVEAGFTCAVALTASVWGIIEDIPPSKSYRDMPGRLWDVLWMGQLAARRHRDTNTCRYRLICHHGRKTYLDLKMVMGPSDDGLPCVTIMLPYED